MLEIILREQYHTVLQPNDVWTGMNDIDLQFLLRYNTKTLVSQKHVIVVTLFSKPIETIAI